MASGDAEVKRSGDPIDDVCFRWIKPPDQRKYQYPRITYDDPGELRHLPPLGLNEQPVPPVKSNRSLEETWTVCPPDPLGLDHQ